LPFYRGGRELVFIVNLIVLFIPKGDFRGLFAPSAKMIQYILLYFLMAVGMLRCIRGRMSGFAVEANDFIITESGLFMSVRNM